VTLRRERESALRQREQGPIDKGGGIFVEAASGNAVQPQCVNVACAS
jgi:hypothetical protein